MCFYLLVNSHIGKEFFFRKFMFLILLCTINNPLINIGKCQIQSDIHAQPPEYWGVMGS